MDYEGDSDLLAQPVVEGSSIKIGDLVTAKEIAHTSKDLKGIIKTWEIRESVIERWLTERKPERAQHDAKPYQALLDGRRETRLLAHVKALRRMVNGIDKLGRLAEYHQEDQARATAVLIEMRALALFEGGDQA